MTLSYIPSDTNAEGILKAAASGTLPNGKPVLVNADGTVSVVAETNLTQAAGNTTQISNVVNADEFAATYDANAQKVVVAYTNTNSNNRGDVIVGTVSGESISFGDTSTFASGGTTEIEIAYDANAQKVVIIYRNTSGSNYGTAIVGTVSGTSISFGSAVVFNSALTQTKSISYDSSNQVVVVSYRNGGVLNRGQAVVGTVSGTSISFGSVATFNYGDTEHISSCYDVASGKTVVVYEDEGNSQEGTAVVGTVSGTSISFGSEATFSGGYSINVVKAAYDEKSEKVVIGYHASSSGSGPGTAIVGTVSGTSISFGSAVTFNSSNVIMKSIVYNAASQNMVLCYRINSSSDIEAIVGTVSGTSISFGGAVTLDSGGGGGSIISSAYDASGERVVVCFKDTADSNKAKATIFRTAYTAKNLTSENYIGISSGGTYADGSNATVNIIGNTSDDQSSLTAGQSYFVQTDGTIGLTADDPSVFAGTAISATRLIIKT